MRLLTLMCLLSLAGSGCDVFTPSDFSLRVETPALTVQRGTSADILVHIDRTGREQPVHVALRNPPEGVSVEPIQVAADQESGTLHVVVSEQVVAGAYSVDVVATGSGRTDSDSISLQVTDIPASAPIVVAFEQSPLVLEKGKTHDVSLGVDRSGGFTGSFLVEPGGRGPWLSFESLTVPYDATQFTLKLKVDERQPVGSTRLALKLSSGAHQAAPSLPLEITSPQEAPPLLTSVDPSDIAIGVSTRFTLKGTGLSSTTAVRVRNLASTAEPFQARLLSATMGEVQAEVAVYRTQSDTGEPQLQLELVTPTGSATWSLTASPLYVDAATGSDTLGRGTLSHPFATISRARSSCYGCNHPVTDCRPCSITLAPGIHRPGSLVVDHYVSVVGSGALHGHNPSVIEGSGTEQLKLHGGSLRQVKVTGYKKGLEAYRAQLLGGEHNVFPVVRDVWLTGGDYGISVCGSLIVATSSAPVRISHNRVAGVSCEGSVMLWGSADWPVEITDNGDGSEQAGGVVTQGSVTAKYVVISHNQGSGVKAKVFTARNSTLRENAGPGVWAYSAFGPPPSEMDLGTVESPGDNILQDNAINLRIDGAHPFTVSAVGNCWNPPAGEDYADTTADGPCGRIRKPFSRGDTTYIDAAGKTQAPFTWTAPPRFNYFLAPSGAGTSTLQF